MWVDELTKPVHLTPRGQARLDYESGLRDQGLPVRVLRIAGIYGPGRTLREQIERDALILFEGQPPTSRIHVEDLVRLIEAMMEPKAPELAVACDELPATTTEIARYTCSLLGRMPPEPVQVEDARRVLSPQALEMRLGGHRCRSLVRERLIGKLTYPTYLEGIPASLEAEGALIRRR
jgi:nucleoside-diphosphate-sugar epimerase